MPNKILVLGSSNVDFVLRIPHFHEPGETLQSEDVVTVLGGTGANQAVMAAKLGAQVGMVTKVGQDVFGDTHRHGRTRHLTLRGAPGEVAVGVAEGLRHDSAVNLDHVQTVEKALLVGYVGTLGSEKMRAVCRALAVAVGCDGS